MFYTSFDSPIGELMAVGDGRALHGLYIQQVRTTVTVHQSWEPNQEPFAPVRGQLGEYFAGRRRTFDLPLAMVGSPFQRRVWEGLQEIPYGETISYGELARRIGVPSSPRAVGVANRHNPFAVIVPCHRVIGADGSLTGYAGGLERKRFLLDLESGVLTLDRSVRAGFSSATAGGDRHRPPAPRELPARALQGLEGTPRPGIG